MKDSTNMPKKTTYKVVTRGRRMRGRGKVLDWLKGAAQWVKSNIRDKHVISKVSGALAKAGVPYADKVNEVSSSLGWGRRRRGTKKTGRGLKLAGHGRMTNY